MVCLGKIGRTSGESADNMSRIFRHMISEVQAHKYCREPLSKIEGYLTAIASPERYEIHHRFGELAPTRVLKQMGYYYSRPACELIFVQRRTHHRIHFAGKPKSEAMKARLRAKHAGKVLTEEHKAAIGRGVLRRLAEDPSIREKLSAVWRGRKHTDAAKEKIRIAALNRGPEYSLHNSKAVAEAEGIEVSLYREYRRNGGPLKWAQWRHFHKIEKEQER